MMNHLKKNLPLLPHGTLRYEMYPLSKRVVNHLRSGYGIEGRIIIWVFFIF